MEKKTGLMREDEQNMKHSGVWTTFLDWGGG